MTRGYQVFFQKKKRPAYPTNPACSARAFVGSGASPVCNRDKLQFYVSSHRTCQGPIRFLRKYFHIPGQDLGICFVSLVGRWNQLPG